jgi:hypothetical protein
MNRSVEWEAQAAEEAPDWDDRRCGCENSFGPRMDVGLTGSNALLMHWQIEERLLT